MIEFRTSSFCTLGNCVEIGALPDGGVAMRDTKDTTGQTLQFTSDAWRDFVALVKSGVEIPG